MSSPPSTKKLVGSDISDDWSQAKDTILLPLNKFLSDVNEGLSSGIRLDENLGCQIWTFQARTGSPWKSLTYAHGWVDYAANLVGQYRIMADGSIKLRGAMKSGTIAAVAFTLPTGFRPEQGANVACDSNGAHGRLYVDPTGDATPFIGNNTYFSLDTVHFFPATPIPYAPSCFPVVTKCTLPNAQALKLKLGLIQDVTAGSTPLVHGATDAVWRNDAGNIRIDNIPGLLPNRTYSITAIAYPR